MRIPDTGPPPTQEGSGGAPGRAEGLRIVAVIAGGREAAPLTISMPPHTSRLAQIRLVLRRSLPPRDPDDASLYYGAVTEILVNAIEAHELVGCLDPVVVDVHPDEPRGVVVRDCGPGFDPTSEIEPQSHGSGHGLRIARAVCPELSIESSASGTTVTLPFPT